MNKEIKIGKDSFIRYCYKSRYQLALLGFFLVLAYGMKIFNLSISHDTEAMIAVPENMYGSWLQMGRFGEIVLKKLLGTYSLNLYVAGFMMVVGMLLVTVLWSYLFFTISGERNKILLWVFGTVCFTSTIMAEQEAFLLQAYEVTVAMGLVAVALILFLDGRKNKRWYECVASALVLMLSFATYQAMVVLYIAAAAMCFLLFYEKNASQTNLKEQLFYILHLILLFVSAYLIYAIANKVILKALNIETTSYIEGQMAWQSQGIRACIGSIYHHVIEVLKGENFFYTKALIILIVFATVKLMIQKKEKNYWLYSLAMLFVFGCPFLMTIVLGERPSYRTELNIPFVIAFLACIVIDFFRQKKRWIYQVSIVLVFLLGMNQAQATARMYYTEYVQNQEDMILAIKISDRIEQLDVDTSQVPVIFIGGRGAARNLSCLESSDFGLTGWSFFEISYGTGHGTWVMQHYLSTLGINYLYPNEGQIAIAEEAAANMQAWPNTNSVQYINGVVVVKLSN